MHRCGLKDNTYEKEFRGNILIKEQKEENRKKSTIRSVVEHVFGIMEGAVHGLVVWTIGIAMATANIFLKCIIITGYSSSNL